MTCPNEIMEELKSLDNELYYSVIEGENGFAHLTYYFRGYICQVNVSPVIEMLHHWDADFPDSNWEFVVNTEGGEMAHGSALYSTLRRYSILGGGIHHLTTRVAGSAASAGSLIFQAGDLRVGGPIDFLMIHEPVGSFLDEPVSSMRNKLSYSDMWLDKFTDICLERCTLSRGAFLKRFQGKDWWIPMDEAVKLGLADRVE